MKKYPLDKSLKSMEHFKPPFNSFIFFFAKLFMPSVNFLLKRKKINFKRISLSTDGKAFNTYIIYPNDLKKKSGALIYLHGGGFAFKANSSQINNFLETLNKTNLIGVLIDYSVAKEHPLPNKQVSKAFNFLLENSANFNIDKNNIFLSGDSAGGFLALDLLEWFKYPFAGLLLLFPVVDQKMNTESMRLFVDTPVWNAKSNKKMWKKYSGGKRIKSILDSENLKYFPPTFIEVCEFDCLRDEGLALFNKLDKEGIDVTLNYVHGATHGYDTISKGDLSKESQKMRIDFIINHINENYDNLD